MVALHPYPRGFLLSRSDSAARAPESWSTLLLPWQDWRFSHDDHYQPDLSVAPDGASWVLVHGLCLYAGPEKLDGSISQHLLDRSTTGEDAFLSALDELGGRHIIMRGTDTSLQIYHDASGLRSVYGSRQAQIIASHVHLIQALHPHPERGDHEGARALNHSWDRTRFVGVEPLLPNHRLNVPAWNIERFFPRARNPYEDWDLDAKLDMFQRVWTTQLDRMAALDTTLVMSITGGSDSRTSLALSAAHVRDIKFFTYTAKRIPESTWSESLALDRELVEQLKELVPMDHQYFASEKRDFGLLRRLDPLLDVNTTQQHSRWLVAFYASAFPEGGYTHIRGNNYEVGRAYWGAHEGNDSLASLKNLYMSLTKSDQGHVSPETRTRQFWDGVKKWGYDEERHGYHIRDLLYWEIRSGRWLAEILNETDIAFETFVPMNVRDLLNLSLSMPLAERQNASLFAELINRTVPVLNFPGKNDPRNLYEQTRDDRLERAGRHVAADATYLTKTLEIVAPEGDVIVLPAVRNEIALPADSFRSGAQAMRNFAPLSSSSPQTLSFVVDSPYCNPLAVDKFTYEVYLNGEEAASWDGAAFNRPVHVTVDDLTREDTVSMVVRSRSHQKGRNSWEMASRAFIRNVKCVKAPSLNHSRSPAIWTDAPSYTQHFAS